MLTPARHPLILLTGATGHIGGRLMHRLQEEDRPLRCLTRRPDKLLGQISGRTEIAAGNLLDPESLAVPLRCVHTAYYLVHSMDVTGDFTELDRRAATNFANAARDAGVARIVYLGGLGSGGDLSDHLASRHEVGQILRASRVPTIELRASIVIGPGSASFEAVRALVERLPAIPAPSWVETATQPIALDDVIEYLLAALVVDPGPSDVFEIGGGDRLSYVELMREYARQRNLRRPTVRIPLITPRASRRLLGVLTPGNERIVGAMVDSLRHESVVRDLTAHEAFPVEPRGVSEAIADALAAEDREFAQTRWPDALTSTSTERLGGARFGRRMVSSRAVRVNRPANVAFGPIQRIGGGTGWYAHDWFWALRGGLDELRGGVGLRRGRRHPYELRVGDAVDFWRVEHLEPGRRLRLCAEMKIPGRLWLEFEVEPEDDGSRIRQTTVFDPAGYIGRAYWYLLYPVHKKIFRGVLQGLSAAAITTADRAAGPANKRRRHKPVNRHQIRIRT